MQNSLNLTVKIPDTLPQAQQMCKDLLDVLDKTNASHKEHIDFINQRIKIVLRKLRPDIITEGVLRELFDEADVALDPMIEMTTEGEAKESEQNKKKTSRKKKRKAIPDHLPRTVIEHDLSDDEKTCANDQNALSPMGYDVKEELKYTPAKFEVIEHRYLKYSCASCRGAVKRVAREPAIVSESYVSASLLSHIAVSKFVDHLPLYRQAQIFNREGIHITRQVMASWIIKLGESLKPLIGLMHEEILEAEVVSADETPVRLLTKNGVRTSSQCYMWQLSRWGKRPRVIFEYDQTRSKEVAKRLFGDYTGYIQIDGYAGYDALFSEDAKRKRVGCLAHVFRKFRDYLESLDKTQRANHPSRTIMRLIDKLYDIEEPLKGFSPTERLKCRKESDAEKIFEEISTLVRTELDQVSKKSPYYAALKYADDELPLIKRYLEHGAIEIDNNYAENAIRPFALGRRNWLFICSEKGAQASANIYSLLITAKANGVEPYSYLERVIGRLPHCKTIEDYEALLPNEGSGRTNEQKL